MAGVDLRGKRAIVTGASSGIGDATVKQLREAGVRVAGGARRVDAIDADVALELDVTDAASCAAFVERALAELGGVDILVNNAGLALGRDPFVESTEEDEQTVIETNISGVVRITRLALPHLEHGGHIVNMGSIAAIWPYEKGTLYCLSKAAVHTFSRALREDLLGKPIRITTLAPGLVETDGFSLVRFRGDDGEGARGLRRTSRSAARSTPRTSPTASCSRSRGPPHVNVDEIVVTALAQSTGTRIVRD